MIRRYLRYGVCMAIPILALHWIRTMDVAYAQPIVESPLFGVRTSPAKLSYLFEGSSLDTTLFGSLVSFQDEGGGGSGDQLPFESSNDQQNRKCSTTGNNTWCSIEPGEAGDCSARGKNAACSVESTDPTGSKCSSKDPAGRCSVTEGSNADGDENSHCSAQGNNHQCTAWDFAHCSVYKGGKPSPQDNSCSTYNNGNPTCSTFSPGAWCSVKKGQKNAKCTAIWGEKTACSAHGGGTCSVVNGTPQEPDKNGRCYGSK